MEVDWVRGVVEEMEEVRLSWDVVVEDVEEECELEVPGFLW